ncbi:MAG: aminoglycoside phosphotransferase family protein [archaeon]|nr:aminoglycoside phosphotransferase family protein [archaeon]MCR4323397.1 aminoglycoside phosphotransferase family protein [Nanoarchaeota archaeon]
MEDFNRNFSEVYEVEGQKIVSKRHQKPIFLRRELFFYDLFQKTGLVRTPKVYGVEGLCLKTHFIETEKKDILQTAAEWARVHSYFIKNPLPNNRLLFPHNIQAVASFILENKDAFGELGALVEKALSDLKVEMELTTILHGDLQDKNMVTFQGQNYYFDFELSGLGHPGRDVASMIISNPDRRKEIERIYRTNIDFDYSLLGEDTNTWLIARAAELYLILSKRKGPTEVKRRIKSRLLDIIQSSK